MKLDSSLRQEEHDSTHQARDVGMSNQGYGIDSLLPVPKLTLISSVMYILVVGQNSVLPGILVPKTNE
jgi:hypothetical protein